MFIWPKNDVTHNPNPNGPEISLILFKQNITCLFRVKHVITETHPNTGNLLKY